MTKTIRWMGSQILRSKEDMAESILQEAERLITGDRRGSYGHPADEYDKLARTINAVLGHKFREPITAEETMLIMVLMKINRYVNNPGHRDSLVDAAGYLGCIELAQDERAKRTDRSLTDKPERMAKS